MSEAAKRNRILFVLIACFSVAGMTDSVIALQRHYAKSDTNFCDFSQKFSCDIVNRSEYSTVLDVPVAGIGVAGYAVLFIYGAFWRSRPETPNRLLAFAVAGLAFALYLTYVEAYVLKTWCILCLVSLGLIVSIAAFASAIKLRTRES